MDSATGFLDCRRCDRSFDPPEVKELVRRQLANQIVPTTGWVGYALTAREVTCSVLPEEVNNTLHRALRKRRYLDCVFTVSCGAFDVFVNPRIKQLVSSIPVRITKAKCPECGTVVRR